MAEDGRMSASKRAAPRASKQSKRAVPCASEESSRRSRGGAWLSALCALSASSLQPGLDQARAEAPTPQQGAHGALAMEQQRQLLDKLGPHPASGPPPLGVDAQIWQAAQPAGNELNDLRAALGRDLYFDTRLSRDGSVACATCHDVSRGFTDRRPLSEGIGDKVGRRNAPSTLNAVLLQTQFWDGRAATLEDQAKLPITNPIEMGMPDGAAAVAAIAADEKYKAAFQAAYGRPISFDDIGAAIASFERTLVFLDAPFDRFVAGDVSAISDEAKRGWALFQGKGRCASCHQFNAANPLGTNNKFHNVGVSARHKDFESLAQRALKEIEASGGSTETKDRLALETDLSELGRFVVTTDRTDIGAFRTSQLRNIGLTAPYMHDGSLTTLWDVMDHYNKGGEANPYLDGGIEPLALTDAEVDQLVAFMFSLSDARFADQNSAELRRQRELKNKQRPFKDEKLSLRKVLPFEGRLTGKK